MIRPSDPGLYFEAVRAPEAEPPLRNDVAGFIGETERGPVNRLVRVEGWREYEAVFGGSTGPADGPAALTPEAARSYFENGGEILHVYRVAGPSDPALGGAHAGAIGAWPAPGQPGLPVGRALRRPGDLGASAFEVAASSPGAWANELRVLIRYRRDGLSGGRAADFVDDLGPEEGPEIDLEVRRGGATIEVVRGLPATWAARFAGLVSARSRYLRLRPTAVGPVPPAEPSGAATGPARRAWEVRLANGADGLPTRPEYLLAVARLDEEPEVALVALPDVNRRLPPEEAAEVWRTAIDAARGRQDRLVLLDLPPGTAGPDAIRRFVDEVGMERDEERRAAALYHPWIEVPPPPGVAGLPRRIPPSGPVAGVISRLDRARGSHHTPANARLFDGLTPTESYEPLVRGRLNDMGVNLLRCFPNRGLLVWGGRTLDVTSDTGRFVAHRRLIHRLVRAIRRVAEPLVFDGNGPELWLTFSRAVSSVLLEAHRAGALKGERPEQAFRVRCDAETNAGLPEGQVLCEIQVAPAVPMEFITLRISHGREGELEVFEP